MKRRVTVSTYCQPTLSHVGSVETLIDGMLSLGPRFPLLLVILVVPLRCLVLVAIFFRLMSGLALISMVLPLRDTFQLAVCDSLAIRRGWGVLLFPRRLRFLSFRRRFHARERTIWREKWIALCFAIFIMLVRSEKKAFFGLLMR